MSSMMKDKIKRFIWNQKVNSPSNLANFARFKEDCSKYDRCFLVGTGPSLTTDDLEKLKDDCFFVSNRFLFYKGDYHPMAYFCQDPTGLDDMKEEINNYTNAKYKFINSNILRLNNAITCDNTIFYDVNRENYNKGIEPGFYDDGLHVYDGYTVTYSMMQVAIGAGFKKIYLLGIDANYIMNNNGDCDLASSYPKEINDNLKAGMRGGTPNVDYQIASYKRAKQYCDNSDVTIYNATRGGKLEVYERVNFDDLFKK